MPHTHGIVGDCLSWSAVLACKSQSTHETVRMQLNTTVNVMSKSRTRNAKFKLLLLKLFYPWPWKLNFPRSCTCKSSIPKTQGLHVVRYYLKLRGITVVSTLTKECNLVKTLRHPLSRLFPSHLCRSWRRWFRVAKSTTTRFIHADRHAEREREGESEGYK